MTRRLQYNLIEQVYKIFDKFRDFIATRHPAMIYLVKAA